MPNPLHAFRASRMNRRSWLGMVGMLLLGKACGDRGALNQKPSEEGYTFPGARSGFRTALQDDQRKELAKGYEGTTVLTPPPTGK